MEGDASPPLGARRRFSALMDTHRFALPADGETEFLSRQVPIKVRGTSLDGTSIPSPNLLEQKNSLKDINGAGVCRRGLCHRCKKKGCDSEGKRKKLKGRWGRRKNQFIKRR